MSPALALAYWLGPWTQDRTPGGVSRRSVRAGAVECYVYDAIERPRAVYVVAQGMHFLGPDDPRLDRFCRVLAKAGFRVVAPKLRDFLALRMAESVTGDLALAVAFAAEDARVLGVAPPTLMSISFGSRPAIAVAAADVAGDVGRLVLFGGFFDFDATVRFAITGRAEGDGKVLEVPRDPLNAPVVFLNLLPWLDGDAERAVVAEAWREMVVATWGKMELKREDARAPIAHAIGARLGPAERDLFLLGCTLQGDAEGALERALARGKGGFAWTDPSADLAKVRVPITIVHGKDDDVIPVFEADKLARAAPRAEVLLTGMYGHTGSALPSPRAIAGEIATLIKVVRRLGETGP